MKKYTLYKTIQLIFFILIAVGLIAWIFPVASVYHEIAHNPTLKLLAASVWFVLLGSFVFILLDYIYFFGYLKEYKEMDIAVRSDPLSGLANRFSCDVIIEKYLNQPLPKNLGCMMIELSNIGAINKSYGHIQGNMAIRDFSNILSLSSIGICFVGRNGGNKFLAIFENSSPDDMNTFIDRINLRVAAHNRDSSNCPFEYKYGSSYSNLDHVKDITELVSMANSRIVRDDNDISEVSAEGESFENELSFVSEENIAENTAKVETAENEIPLAEEIKVEEEQSSLPAEEVRLNEEVSADEQVSPVIEDNTEKSFEWVKVEDEAKPVAEAVIEENTFDESISEASADAAAEPLEWVKVESEKPVTEVSEAVIAEPIAEAAEELRFDTLASEETIPVAKETPIVESVLEVAEDVPAEAVADAVENIVIEPVAEAAEELKFDTLASEDTIPVAEEAPVVESVLEAAEDVPAETVADAVENIVIEPVAEAAEELKFDTLESEETIPVAEEAPVVESVLEAAEDIPAETVADAVENIVIEPVAEAVKEIESEVKPVEIPVQPKVIPTMSNEEKFAFLIKALEEINSVAEESGSDSVKAQDEPVIAQFAESKPEVISTVVAAPETAPARGWYKS